MTCEWIGYLLGPAFVIVGSVSVLHAWLRR